MSAGTFYSFSWSDDKAYTSGFGSCSINTAPPKTTVELEAAHAVIRKAREDKGLSSALVLLWWHAIDFMPEDSRTKPETIQQLKANP